MFLQPLVEFAETNQTPAGRKLGLFHGEWNGSVDPVFKEFVCWLRAGAGSWH